MNRKDRAVLAYLGALESVESQGCTREIDLAQRRQLELVTPQVFLDETAWVVLSSGMREYVVRRVFPRIQEAFGRFEAPSVIASAPQRCVRRALRWFNHPGKLAGIVDAAAWLTQDGIESILFDLSSAGPTVLQRIPFIGPVTSLHLAKNLGVPVAKPDRHLVRITRALNFATPAELCSTIAFRTGDDPGLVDLVLWRFATMTPGYEERLRASSANPDLCLIGSGRDGHAPKSRKGGSFSTSRSKRCRPPLLDT